MAVPFPSLPRPGSRIHDRSSAICKVRLSRPIEGQIKTCTIKREADGWYVIFAVETVVKETAPVPQASFGIDVGIEHFATLSDDQAKPIKNPKYLCRGERALKKAQRRISRRIKGSQRRKKAVRLLARQHLKVKRLKEAKKLVDRYQSIKVEDLKVKNMVKNHRLAKSISDAGWSQFIVIIVNKAEEAHSNGDQGESSLYLTRLLALRKSEPDHASNANLSLHEVWSDPASRPQQRQED